MSIRFISRVLLVIFFAFGFMFAQQTASVSPSGAAPPDGAAIFSQHCAKCHGEKGEGISAKTSIAGPNLQAEHDTGLAMTAIEVGPSHMPSFAWVLSVPQMRAVANYVTQNLAVIPLAGGNIGEGGTLFRTNCAPCHRTAVGGGALAFTGINAPDLSGKSEALVAGAIRWGPGPMPSFPPAVISDKQLDSIVEYVKFVQHPPDPGGNPLRYYGPVAEGFAAWIAVFALVVFAGWIERGGRG